MRRGAFDRAERALDEAAGLGAIGGPGALGGWLELARLELAWLRADAPDAGRWAAAIPFVPGVWGADVGAWVARWHARLGLGERAALVDAAGRHPDPGRRAALVAEVEAASAQPPDAVRWGSAASAWDEAGRPWEAAWARLDAAAAHFTARDSAAGRAALESVVATADALESPPLRARALALARRARIHLEPATRVVAGADEPTDREREVLLLLAEGLTNPQIAERLFLSPKTVGIHVSRLLAKLDAHTRGEAVAVARRRGVIG
jgi:DNA-binding CsgD family transcriptional regulator